MLFSKKVFITGICLFLAIDLYSGICGAFEFSFEGKATGIYVDHYMAPCRPFRFLNEHLYNIPAILTGKSPKFWTLFLDLVVRKLEWVRRWRKPSFSVLRVHGIGQVAS